MVLGSLLLVGAARVIDYHPPTPPATAVVERYEINFVDRSNGAIEVYSPGRAAPIDTLLPGSEGFIRGVLRGLARERRAEGVGTQPWFRLTRWADGRLSLDDPSTGRHVDLEVFGPQNSAAFARLLIAARGDTT
jgi:putative photosynthetic complex assembly protein